MKRKLLKDHRADRILLKVMMDRKKKAQEPQFLTEAHKKNEEAAAKQIEEWQTSPPTLEEALKKQREREEVPQYLSENYSKNNTQKKKKKVSEMTREERLSLIAFKNVMDRKKKAQEPQFLTEAHKENYEKGMETYKNINPSEVDWDKESERQKKNARND